jgi:type I restriction enzyme, S subunit
MVIPEGWKRVELGEILQTKSGGTPLRNIPIYYNGDIPWITTGELNDSYILETKEKITMSGLQNSAAQVFPPNTVLLAMYGATIGKLGIIISAAATNQACCAFFPDDRRLNGRFLFYILLNIRKQLISMGVGAGQPNISQKLIRKICAVLPPVQEQTAIATALSDMDDLIASLEKLLAKKQGIKQGAMQDLLTGRKRLKGFSGKWKYQGFKDTFDLLPNNTYSRDNMNDFIGPYLNVHYGDVLIKYGAILDCEKAAIPHLDSDIRIKNQKMFAQEGDIIIADTAEDNAVGKVTELFNIGKQRIISGLHTILCRPKKQEFAPKWLGYFMNASIYHNQLLPYITGIKVSSIAKNCIVDTIIYIPDIAEQRAIATFLSDMDAELTALQQKLAKYRHIKQGMMAELLTGRIRLKEA